MNVDRARGAFLGLALGDAYGRPLEFVRSSSVRTQVVDTDADFHWTDDTHMALYLGAALLEVLETGIDEDAFGHAVAQQFVRWLHDPLMPSTAPGNTCIAGARAYERTGDWRHSGVEASDGCGAVMRICPLPLALCGDTLTMAAEVSAQVTHGHPNAREAAIAASHLLRWTLEEGRFHADLVRRAAAGLRGEWRRGGTVADSLEAALAAAEVDGDWLDEVGMPPGDGGWRSGSALGLACVAALRWGHDPTLAMEKAARIEGDSDSVACLTGMYLGAAGGVGVLPAAWLASLPRRAEIEALATDLARRPSC